MAPYDMIPNMEGRFICDGGIKINHFLGAGGFGVVYQGETLGQVNAPVAVKFIPRQGLTDHDLECLDNEIYYHKKVSGTHKSVLELLGWYDDDKFDALIIITEFCALGDMHRSILQQQDFRGENNYTKKIFLGILDAVEALHSSGLYHRDLKPENILQRADGTPVIADFGFSTVYEETYDTGMGTLRYMSPELHAGPGFDDQYESIDSRGVDMWALGIILFNMITGTHPWKKAELSDEAFQEYYLHSAGFFVRHFGLSIEADMLFNYVFAKHAIDRPTIPELRKLIFNTPTFEIPQKFTCTSAISSYQSDTTDVSILDGDSSSVTEPIVAQRAIYHSKAAGGPITPEVAPLRLPEPETIMLDTAFESELRHQEIIGQMPIRWQRKKTEPQINHWPPIADDVRWHP